MCKKFPAAHTHASSEVLPGGATEFAGHAVQSGLPIASEYESAAHCAHACAAPEKPATHWHWVYEVLISCKVEEFPGHGVQVRLPVALLKLPTGQGIHVAEDEF